METKNVEMILGYLDKLAAKLGMTVEQIWPWLVRQQYVDAFFSTVVLLSVAVICYKVAVFVGKHWRPEATGTYSIYRNDHEVPWGFFLVVLAFILVISFVAFCCDFPGALNPEYGALKALMAMAKP